MSKRQLLERANQELRRVEQERQPPPRPEQQRPKRFQDFGDEYLGKEVGLHLADGRSLRVRVIDITKYWLKCRCGMSLLYVNKAHIVSIEVAA